MRSIYAIYDKVAQAQYGALVMQQHDGPVARLFFDLLQDKEQPMSRHVADYELWRIGTISDDLVVSGVDQPYVVATGMQFLLQQEKEFTPTEKLNLLDGTK